MSVSRPCFQTVQTELLPEVSACSAVQTRPMNQILREKLLWIRKLVMKLILCGKKY